MAAVLDAAGVRAAIFCGYSAATEPFLTQNPETFDAMSYFDATLSMCTHQFLVSYSRSIRVDPGRHSMGGYDSLLFQIVYPSRVLGLVLYGTGPGFAKDAARIKWNETAEAMAAKYDSHGMAALQGSDARKGHTSVEGLSLLCRGSFAQREDDQLFSRLSYGALTAAKMLGEINVPVAIIVGERDKGFLGASQMMRDKIKGALYSEIPGGGHLVSEKMPEEFNIALVKSLNFITRRLPRL